MPEAECGSGVGATAKYFKSASLYSDALEKAEKSSTQRDLEGCFSGRPRLRNPLDNGFGADALLRAGDTGALLRDGDTGPLKLDATFCTGVNGLTSGLVGCNGMVCKDG